MLAIIVLIFFALFAYPAQSQVPPGNCGTVSSCNQASTPLTGAEQIFVNQGGTTKRALLSQIPGTCNSGSNCPAYFSAIGTLINPAAGTLRANTAAVLLANVAGYYGPGTAGGGTFVKTTGSCSDNGGTVIKDSAGQCWDRQYAPNNGPGVQDFGAKCDAATDDSAAIQAALTYIAANGGTLTSPGGQRCEVHGLTLTWDGHAVILAGNGGDFSNGGSQWDYNGPTSGTLLTAAGGDVIASLTVEHLALNNASGLSANGVNIFNLDPGPTRFIDVWISNFDVGSTDAGMIIGGNFPPLGGSQVTNSVYLDGVQFSDNSISLYSILPTAAEIWVTRTRFLGSKTAAIYSPYTVTDGVDNSITELHVQDSTFYGTPGETEIQLYGGYFYDITFENSHFEAELGAPLINVSSGATFGDFRFVGNDLGNAGSSADGLLYFATSGTGTMAGLDVVDNMADGLGASYPEVVFGGTAAITHYRVDRFVVGAGGSDYGATITYPSATCSSLLCSDYISSYTTPACAIGVTVGSTPQTMSSTTCEATTNGRVTTVSFNIQINGAASGSGNVELTGLPTVGPTVGGVAAVTVVNGAGLGGTVLAAPTAGGTVAPLYTQGSSSLAAMTNTNLGSNAQISGTLVYANQ